MKLIALALVAVMVHARLAYSASCLVKDNLPDSACTPGKANPVLTKEKLCDPKFRTGPYRNVPESEKRDVFRDYGISWPDHSKYEVDHLISLEIGGSNDVANLWPQIWCNDGSTSTMHNAKCHGGAHDKDVVENRMHKMVCAGQISLQDAQQCISTNWQKCP